MTYIFHDNQLYWSGYGLKLPIPKHSYIYSASDKTWIVKYERSNLRPIKWKHIPAWIKTLMLIMDIH